MECTRNDQKITTMNKYLNYVRSIVENIEQAEGITLSSTSFGKANSFVKGDKKIFLFSPHPDDECIIGLLPLRLQRELNYQVVNVPMTFGSNPERRDGRLAELENACAYLGWHNYRARTDLESLTVDDVVRILLDLKPEIIVFPHDGDWNSRHIEVHNILLESLRKMPIEFSCLIVESEFWGAMDTPNTHVEANVEQLSELITATAYHVEEVARNPYHLRLPAWMQDNVRRGAELVGGQGKAAPAFQFSTLYRVQIWKQSKLRSFYENGRVIPCGSENLKFISQWKSL